MKIFGSDICPSDLAKQKTLIFLNEVIDDFMKIVKSLKDVVLLIKDVRRIVENEEKKQKGEFLGMLAAMLGASLLGNLLAGKEVIRVEETTKAGQDFYCRLIL